MRKNPKGRLCIILKKMCYKLDWKNPVFFVIILGEF